MTDESMKMTYSAILRNKDNKKIVRVIFERGSEPNVQRAEGVLPDCVIDHQNGYSAEEISSLEEYMKSNLSEIMDRAKVISNPLKWL
jgi:hypothetical protein